MNKNPYIGSTFEDFLKAEGISADVNTAAIKRVLAWQIAETMKSEGITKSKMAKRMHTSRSQLDRLLDPKNDKILLATVQKAAAAVGKRLVLGLEDDSSAAA